MSESWQINPTSGDYVMEGGSPVPSESLTIPAYYRLKVQRGRWLHAPDDGYGSDFYLIRKRFNGGDLSGLQNIAEKALQPMIDDGRASDVEVTPNRSQQTSRNNSLLGIKIADAQGQVEELDLPPIVVGG